MTTTDLPQKPSLVTCWTSFLSHLKKEPFLWLLSALVFGIGTFLYFFFAIPETQGWFHAISENNGLWTSQGNGLLFFEPFIRWLGPSGFFRFGLALIYVVLAILYWIFAGRLLIGEQTPFYLRVVGLFFFGFVFFNPLNGNSSPSGPYLYLSALVLLGYFWSLRRFLSNENPRLKYWILPCAFSVLSCFLLASSFTFIALLMGFAYLVYSWVKGLRRRNALILFAVSAILFIAHQSIYWASGSSLLPSFSDFSFKDYLLNVLSSLAPNSFGSLTIWKTDIAALQLLAKLIHVGIILFGSIMFACLVACCVLDVRRGLADSLVPFLAKIGLISLCLWHGLFNAHPMANDYDAAFTLFFLAGATLCACDLKTFFSHRPAREGKKDRTNLLVGCGAVLLAICVSVSALGSYGTARYGFWNSDPQALYALKTAGKPADIAVDDEGNSCIGLNQQESFNYVTTLRKNRFDMFSTAPITNDFYTTGYYYGLSGYQAPQDPAFDHWCGENFRVLLNSGDSETLFFHWFITDAQFGGTMTIYVDGVEKYHAACTENQNEVSLPNFNKNENYFIQCIFDKKVEETEDIRPLYFFLTSMNFKGGVQ
ncbi:MAG: hypothetical protein IJU64_00955 [Bacilli bacterium]|nr:hypothetical protein [Bacilli bacterium]